MILGVCFLISNGSPTRRPVATCTSYKANSRQPPLIMAQGGQSLSAVCEVWLSQSFFVLIACQGDVPFLSSPSSLVKDLLTSQTSQILKQFSSLR